MKSTATNGTGKQRRITSEILDREPPFNLEAEAGVLGSMILNSSVCDDVVLVVRAADFYDDANRKLFEHLVAMHGEGQKIDVTLLVERLKSSGDFERVGGAAFIARTAHSVANAAHAKYYAVIVANKSVLRNLLDAGTEIIRDAYENDDIESALQSAEQSILAIRDRRTDGTHTKSASDLSHIAMDNLDARKHGTKSGIATGFSELDRLVIALNAGTLTIIAGRTGMGKTAFAMNILENASIDQQIQTLFISLEMSAGEIADRLIASQARVDSHHIQDGTYSDHESKRIVDAGARISHGTFSVDDAPSRTVGTIAALARRHKRKYGLGLLVIDYLQLIASESRRDTRQEEVAEISRRIKAIARELQVPVICLAQLNRQTEDAKENRPRLSHLRESGAIEQDADLVIFVHRPGYYSDKPQPSDEGQPTELIVAKHRGGRTGIANVFWFGSFVRFDAVAPEWHQLRRKQND